MNHSHIPPLNPIEQQQNQQLIKFIQHTIQLNGGAISFAQFMDLALHSPYGYYSNNTYKIGQSGDFVTAPLLSPLFSKALSKQLAELLPQTQKHIYEFGAGTGVLAAQLLNQLGDDIQSYYIIEISNNLKKRQQEYIQAHAAQYAHRVIWLNTLPEQFTGLLLGNEVLDAIPIERIRKHPNGQFEQAYVTYYQEQFHIEYQPLANPNLLNIANHYYPNTLITEHYTSELHPTQYAFISTLAQKLKQGAMIWIDYGFDAHQYYHPQRYDGTLIGHHRHHTVHDPFYRIGLTDLTAHINFTDIAQAGCEHNLDLIGYTTQANFLFNLGLLDLLATEFPNTNSQEYIKTAHAIQQLTAHHEMGELFKVIAFGKNIDVAWQGFCHGDLCHKL